jgi:hypothetical protein
LRELARALDEAVAEGRVAPLEARVPGDLQPDEVRLLRGRLFALGYLDVDNERGDFDAALETAWRAFDLEAGLPGSDLRASWQALEELVSFETERAVAERMAEWCARPKRTAALRRAAHLRLFSLGLAPLGPRPRDTGDELERGLEDFAQLLALFDPVAPPPAALSAPLLSRLFDQDAWVARFEEMGETVRFFQPESAGHRERVENRERVTSFVLAIARIELWLQGYAALPRPRTARDAQGLSETVRRAMLDFWADQPEDARPSKQDRATADGRFFARLRALGEEAAREGERSDALLERVEADRDLQRRVRDEARSLSARIWDGVKRAASWVWALFKRVATGVRQLARNTARLLLRGAARVWGVIRASVRAVAETATFLFRETMRGSDPAHLIIRHDGDFDLTLLVSASRDDVKALALTHQLLLRARLAEVGMRIAGHVAQLLRSALTRVAFGWLGLALALYRSAQTLLEWWRDAELAGELLGELDAL